MDIVYLTIDENDNLSNYVKKNNGEVVAWSSLLAETHKAVNFYNYDLIIASLNLSDFAKDRHEKDFDLHADIRPFLSVYFSTINLLQEVVKKGVPLIILYNNNEDELCKGKDLHWSDEDHYLVADHIFADFEKYFLQDLTIVGLTEKNPISSCFDGDTPLNNAINALSATEAFSTIGFRLENKKANHVKIATVTKNEEFFSSILIYTNQKKNKASILVAPYQIMNEVNNLLIEDMDRLTKERSVTKKPEYILRMEGEDKKETFYINDQRFLKKKNTQLTRVLKYIVHNKTIHKKTFENSKSDHESREVSGPIYDLNENFRKQFKRDFRLIENDSTHEGLYILSDKIAVLEKP